MSDEYGTTIFCEDIRDEIGGKKTYVGVFGADIIINGSLPAVINQFAFCVTFLEPISDAKDPLNIKIFLPSENDDEVALDIDLPGDRHSNANIGEIDPTAEFLCARLSFKVIPLVITHEGYIRVRAYKGEREIRLGSIRVRVVDPIPNDLGLEELQQ